MALSEISSIHWGSWDISPLSKGEPLYSTTKIDPLGYKNVKASKVKVIYIGVINLSNNFVKETIFQKKKNHRCNLQHIASGIHTNTDGQLKVKKERNKTKTQRRNR